MCVSYACVRELPLIKLMRLIETYERRLLILIVAEFPAFTICAAIVLNPGRGWRAVGSSINTHLKKGVGISLMSKVFVNAGVRRTDNDTMRRANSAGRFAVSFVLCKRHHLHIKINTCLPGSMRSYALR